mmetsp:Transcript_8921/g.29501  ORF Transcript_8921/g.29501 Transcript_8921/m.29501 type:complete len:235 (-) Transcript_8921:311-1015(-)
MERLLCEGGGDGRMDGWQEWQGRAEPDQACQLREQEDKRQAEEEGAEAAQRAGGYRGVSQRGQERPRQPDAREALLPQRAAAGCHAAAPLAAGGRGCGPPGLPGGASHAHGGPRRRDPPCHLQRHRGGGVPEHDGGGVARGPAADSSLGRRAHGGAQQAVRDRPGGPHLGLVCGGGGGAPLPGGPRAGGGAAAQRLPQGELGGGVPRGAPDQVSACGGAWRGWGLAQSAGGRVV